MLAIDTNIVVRYLTGDDPAQSARARSLVEESDVFVGDTVMLESEWVLRSVYGFEPAIVIRALRSFAGLSRVSVESPAVLAHALDRAEDGMDFADAFHLGRAKDCNGFVTFDGKLIKAARKAGIEGVRTP